MPNNTRLDSKKFSNATEKASTGLMAANQALEKVTILLTEKQRMRISKPSSDFEGVAKTFAASLTDPAFASLCTFAEVEPQAIIEDVNNLDALRALQTKVEAFLKRLSDTELVWRGEIDADVRAVYDVAKARAKTDAATAQLIAPLVEHYTPVRKPKVEAGSDD